MLFATSGFPYGKGEKTFVIPELEKLREKYSVILISHATFQEVKDIASKSSVNEKIKVLHFDRNIKLWKKIYWGVRYFFDKDGWRETKSILLEKKSILLRMYHSIGFYILAMEDYKKILKNRLIKNEENTICYSYWYTYYSYAFLRCKELYPKLKIITRTHGFDLYNERFPGKRQPFKEIMDEKLDGIIFASNYAYHYYAKIFSKRSDRNKYHICRLGVSEGKVSINCAKVGFHLVSCSMVVPLKRIELIIDGLSELKEEVHWIHIGSGSEMEVIQKYAERMLSASSHIHYTFVGYWRQEQIRSFYETGWADCFITTTATEGGCPVSIQEAMSFALPVIGTAVGGVTEMIDGNGILLPSNPKATEVANAILNIYNMSQTERKNVGECSFRLWKEKFNEIINVKHLIETIESIEKV
jgi:glycosyltransferase involved in cell wall biosynthesis